MVTGLVSIKVGAEKLNKIEKLPVKQDISEGRFISLLNDLKSKPEDLQEVLLKLDDETLILAMAEISEYLEKQDASTEMGIFVPIVMNSLIKNLNEEDYIKIISNNDYCSLMRSFYIDMYSFRTSQLKLKKGDKFNNKLREIVLNKDENPKLKLDALANIDNLDTDDIKLIKNILNSSSESELIKGFALEYYNDLDPSAAMELNQDILYNFENYSDREVITALKSVSKNNVSVTLLKNKSHEKLIIDKVKNILSKTDDRTVKDAATFTLGDMKSPQAISAIIKNRDKIGDDSIIRSVIDQNYNVIKDMINNGDLEVALECVEIMPMEDFTADLDIVETKINNRTIKTDDVKIKEKINKVKKKIKENNFIHTKKWDEQR